MRTSFYYVYLLRSTKFPDQTYIGFSENFQQRFKDHNAGKSVHTGKYRPWRTVSCHAFTDLKKAKNFETYLKTGSGRAFAKRRLW
jgi:predicted GIY-YIG superfamily endonuclease